MRTNSCWNCSVGPAQFAFDLEFRTEVADRPTQIRLALSGELDALVRDWNAKHDARMRSNQAAYQLKVDALKEAMAEHAAERSEASQARLKAAQDAFRMKPTPSTAKPFVPPTIFDKANAEREAKRIARGEPVPRTRSLEGLLPSSRTSSAGRLPRRRRSRRRCGDLAPTDFDQGVPLRLGLRSRGARRVLAG